MKVAVWTKGFYTCFKHGRQKKKVSGLFYLSGGRSEKVFRAWPSDNFKYLKPYGSRNSSCNHQWIPTVLRTKSRFLNKVSWPLLTWPWLLPAHLSEKQFYPHPVLMHLLLHWKNQGQSTYSFEMGDKTGHFAQKIGSKIHKESRRMDFNKCGITYQHYVILCQLN